MSSARKTDWASFVAGLLFVSLGAVFLFGGSSDWGITATWVLPVLAVGLGVVAITRVLTRAGGRDRGSEPEVDDSTNSST